MSTDPKSKDTWDKVEIIGKALVIPIIIAVIGILGNCRIAEINKTLTSAEHNIDIMQGFRDTYYSESVQDSRRLSVHFIKLINDPKSRYVLRQFIIWDTLERKVKDSGDFKFDGEESDWHIVGDAMYDMAEDDQEKTREFWCNIKTTTSKRWSEYEEELLNLYEWVRKNYQKDGYTWSDCPKP